MNIDFYPLKRLFAESRQALMLLFITVCVPLDVTGYEKGSEVRLPAFHSLRDSIITFIASLFVFHIYLWVVRTRSSPKIAKYIDYIYLLVATIGLISASDIDRKIYKHDVENIVYLVQAHSSLALMVIRQEEKMCRQNKPDNCADLGVLAKDVEGIEKSLDMEYSSLEQAERAFIRLSSLTDPFPKIRVYLADNLKMNGFHMNQELRALKDAPLGNDDIERIFGFGFGLSQLRQLGFALIAAALALRISKVTVELLEWHR